MGAVSNQYCKLHKGEWRPQKMTDSINCHVQWMPKLNLSVVDYPAVRTAAIFILFLFLSNVVVVTSPARIGQWCRRDTPTRDRRLDCSHGNIPLAISGFTVHELNHARTISVCNRFGNHNSLLVFQISDALFNAMKAQICLPLAMSIQADICARCKYTSAYLYCGNGYI